MIKWIELKWAWKVAAALAMSGMIAAAFASVDAAQAPQTDGSKTIALPGGGVVSLDKGHLHVLLSQANGASRTLAPMEAGNDASLIAMPHGEVWIEGVHVEQGVTNSSHGLSLDPIIASVSSADDAGLPRSSPTLYAVLTDGSVFALPVGTNTASRWSPTDHKVIAQTRTPIDPTITGTTLLRDGSVLLSSAAVASVTSQVFDPSISDVRSASLTELADLKSETPQWTASAPSSDAKDIKPDTTLAIAFSQPLDATSVNSKTVVLFGPEGAVSGRLALADDARLLFITPDRELYTGSSYTVFLKSLRAASGKDVPFGSYHFSTVTLHGDASSPLFVAVTGDSSTAPSLATQGGALSADTAQHALYLSTGEHIPGVTKSNGDCLPGSKQIALCRTHAFIRDGAFYPGRDNAINASGGHWRTYRKQVAALGHLQPLKKVQSKALNARIAAAGSITGRVLRIDDAPVANVTVSAGKLKTRTAADGTFVLRGLSVGLQTLFVDGASASRGDVEYGSFEVGAAIPSNGVLKLAYNMYLPRILPRDKVQIPSPTTQDLVITHPDIPGLEIDIPAGTVIRDRDGKIVTDLAIVPTPVDRAPFPTGSNYPVYFSIMPGGAVIQNLSPNSPHGIQIRYPNYSHAKPGTIANFWNYDDKEGWRIYGKGHVSADGRQFVPDDGVGLTTTLHGSFTLADILKGLFGTPDCGCGVSAHAGDPVDLATGAFVHSWHDLGIADITPLSLDRTYRSGDTSVRAFGIGMSSSYGWFLYDEKSDYSQPKLVLPNLATLPFNPILGNPAGSYSDVLAEWQYTGSQGPFYGALLTHVQYEHDQFEEHWIIQTRDGTQYWFQNEQTNQLNQIVDRFGNATVFNLSTGLLDSVTSPSGRSIYFNYDSNNRVLSAVDSAGRTVTYTYNPAGYLGQVTYPDNTYEKYTYDGSGNLLTIVDRRGNTVLTNQYTNGQVTQQTYADGAIYKFGYTAGTGGYNTQSTATDPNGYQRITSFDPVSHYPSSETLAAGTSLAQTTSYTRNAAGYVTSMTDPLNRQTTMSYDNLGNLISITALAGTTKAVTESFTYTPDFNQVATITDPLNHETQFSYTAGCMTGATNALGYSISVICNAYGQPTSVTDALGHTTNFGYNGYDLRTVTDALGRTKTFTVDGLGRKIAVQDAMGNVSQMAYDIDDRVLQVTDPRNKTTQLTYDNDGNVTAVVLPGGGTFGYKYDNRNRVTKRTDALSQYESWTYDGLNHVLTHVDRKSQTIGYQYDQLGRQNLITYADGSTIQLGYDAGNRVTAINDSANGTLNRGYDGLDRLTSESGPQGSISYQYDAAGRRTQMIAGTQATAFYNYDAGNRLTSIVQGSEQVGFQYDNANRRQTLTLPNGIVATYSYDNANELTGISYAQASGAAVGTLTYGYDLLGRVSGQGGTINSTAIAAATSNGTFDANNRQTSFNGHTQTFDADGNLTGDGTNTYTWNARNQLTQVSQNGVAQLSYTYDALGRRTSKAVGSGTATQYLYDRFNAVQETQGSAINPILVGLGIDERFARNDTTGRTYFLSDALNSTIALTNSSGVIQNTYSYDPYGNTTQSGTGFTNPYQYTGREADTAALYYYRARYYSPQLPGFISEDPITFGGGQLSFYAYVGGDPIMYRDPRGHELMLALIGAGVGAAWGIANGYLSGDRDWQSLALDGLAGAGTGALAGLSNGATLLEAAGAVGTRAVVSMGIESTRQMAKGLLPCHDMDISYVDIGLAGVGSVFGDMSGFGGEGVMGERGATAFGGTMGGAVSTPAAIAEGAQAAADAGQGNQ
ncbi:RHS repeat-associated core domain-containing protein [Dyella caseinilytica]|uniref:Ig-like domain-containing protein n=1 Tax=Dyella caseinilytica TaxID=1849581 RepID=A0ABX7GXU6_9GAMM|nr:RHS repeat-associated core domain-containing protein [Dyella caseinilytica]QRN55313.1 Ig-like domain-containing protein [Dyella caseinilytica]GGA00897.1 hypothetical protein GCM10011408_22400 [Dyella caseinilytica]